MNQSNDIILKEADFVTGFLNQVKEETNFKEHPFETIFGVLGTALSFKFGLLIGGFVSIAEISGYGPGKIGALIDDYFQNQGAKNVSQMKLNPSNVQGAVEHAAHKLTDVIDFDSIKDKLQDLFATNVNDIKEIKGCITLNDRQSAFYVTAGVLNFKGIKRFFRLWRRGNRMGLVSGILMKLIWMFAKGLMVLGIAGGVASMMGLKTKYDKEKQRDVSVAPENGIAIEPGSLGPAGKIPASVQYYSNVSNDVKQTLIRFLNASIANFEIGFVKSQKMVNPSATPISLKEAPGWNEILTKVAKYNWMSISKINGLSAFVAPKIENIAQTLLKSVGVSGVRLERMDNKPMPKAITPRKSTPVRPRIPMESSPGEVIKLLS